MPGIIDIVAFAGSMRTQSFNKQILTIATKHLQELGANVQVIGLEEFDLPLFNQDMIESNTVPAGVFRLKQEISKADALLIASPEYNASITGVLKNALDWASVKITADEETYAVFSNKPTAVISASPGALGGIRSLAHINCILKHLGCFVFPNQPAINNAMNITDGHVARLHNLVQNFLPFAQKLSR